MLWDKVNTPTYWSHLRKLDLFSSFSLFFSFFAFFSFFTFFSSFLPFSLFLEYSLFLFLFSFCVSFPVSFPFSLSFFPPSLYILLFLFVFPLSDWSSCFLSEVLQIHTGWSNCPAKDVVLENAHPQNDTFAHFWHLWNNLWVPCCCEWSSFHPIVAFWWKK